MRGTQGHPLPPKNELRNVGERWPMINASTQHDFSICQLNEKVPEKLQETLTKLE